MIHNTNIKACGKSFNIGTRVILWDEPGGMSFYHGGSWSKGRFTERKINLTELRKIITSFYIHHSVTYFARSAFQALVARNLSCTFIIDDDINEDTGCATIYQLLDCKDAGYSQGGKYNHNGCGVELSYYPDAWDHPDRYSEYNIKRWGVHPHELKSDKIHGQRFKVFAPTDAQVNACIKLAYGYGKAFPDLELKFPRDENGNFISTTVPEDQKKGLLHHFNVTRRKIDAMGFPTDYVEEEVNSLKKKDQMSRSSVLDKLFSWLR